MAYTSQCFYVLLDLDFSCDLSDRTNENIFGSNRAIRKMWHAPQHDPQDIPDVN